jgi:uncharacterized membrane protein YhaH (DUF805 family)
VQNKKKLIRRMAVVASIVLVLGLVAVLLTFMITKARREQRVEERRRDRAQSVERARSYLGELAGRITATPVDPTIVGEVQSTYFEEIPQGRRFVWAMGAAGEFLFGVPREGFARLNTAWDAYESSILQEGYFVDRQDFLRRLVHASDNLDQSDLAPDPDRADETPWSRLRHYDDSDDWMVLSTPLRAADGSALGNLYLKREAVERRWEPWADDTAEGILAGLGMVSIGALTFLWFLLPTWVYVDARERAVRRPMLWSFLVLISLFLGLVVYLIARPEEPTQLQCPGCGREVNGGAFCPHCGHDLATAFCGTCRYPLKPGWAFCPSCRTEIQRAASGDTPAEEAAASEEAPTTPAEG